MTVHAGIRAVEINHGSLDNIQEGDEFYLECKGKGSIQTTLSWLWVNASRIGNQNSKDPINIDETNKPSREYHSSAMTWIVQISTFQTC